MADKIIRVIAELKNLPRVRNELKKFEKSISGVGLAGKKVTKTVKLADKQFLRLSGTVNKTGNKFDRLSTKYKLMEQNMKKGIPLGQQYAKALSRVAVVVPIWMAARAVLQAFFKTMSSGVELVKKLSKELIRAASVIHGTVLSVGDSIQILEHRISFLSIETGVSMDKIVNAFYRFGTVGNEFEASLSGMEAALKTSLALQGDITDVAKTLALTYKLLGHTMNENLSVQEKQLLMGAQLFQLYRTNAFEINEMTGALRQFLPTARTANFTYSQSIALLAALQSAGMKSSRAGRLLRTSITKLVQNLDILANDLGLSVNPQMESTFDVLMRVLGAFKQMEKQGAKLPIKQLKLFAKIFGGVRTQEAAKALVSLYGQVKMNLDDVADSTTSNIQVMDKFNQRVEAILANTDKLMDKNKNLQGIIGRAFLQGVTGSKDFNEALTLLNKFLEKSIIKAQTLGTFLRVMFQLSTVGVGGTLYFAVLEAEMLNASRAATFLGKAMRAVKDEMSLEDMGKLMKEIKEPKMRKALIKGGDKPDTLLQSIRSAWMRKLSKTDMEFQVESMFNKRKAETDIRNKMFEIEDKLPPIVLEFEVATRIEDYERKLKLVELQLQDSSKLVQAESELNEFVKDMVINHSKLRDSKGQLLTQVSEELILEEALLGNYEEILRVMGETNIQQAVLLKLIALVFKYKRASLQTAKEESDIENKRYLEKLQAAGFSAAQVAKERVALARKSGNEKDLAEALHKQDIIRTKEITKQAAIIGKISKGAFKEAFETGDFSNFFDTIREGLREATIDALSEGATNLIMDFTGLDKMLGQGLDTLRMEQAFTTGATQLEMAIVSGSSRGAQILSSASMGGGMGGGFGGGLVLDQPGLGDDSDGGKRGTKFMQGLKNILAPALLAYSLFSGGKGKSNMSQRYATAPGARTVSATTRSTTQAKITSITIAPTFIMEGVSIDDKNIIKEVEGKLSTLMKDMIVRILEDENIGIGNV